MSEPTDKEAREQGAARARQEARWEREASLPPHPLTGLRIEREVPADVQAGIGIADMARMLCDRAREEGRREGAEEMRERAASIANEYAVGQGSDPVEREIAAMMFAIEREIRALTPEKP